MLHVFTFYVFKGLLLLFLLFEQSVEDATGKSDEVLKDEDKLNEELKEMREALEEKSKKLAERTEGAAKYDGFNSRTI